MSRIVLALLAAIMVTTSGCGKFKSAESFYQDAATQHKNGEARAAVIQLKNAVEKDPGYAPARYLLAVVYNETGDFSSAEKEARKALELGFDKGQASIELARALIGQGQGKKVLDEIAATGWQGETLATVTALRGNAHLMLGETESGKADFDQALKLAPGHAGASLGLARVAVTQRDLAGALAHAEQALAKNPGDLDALLFKGDILRATGKTEEAKAAFNAALKVRKDHVGAYLSLASIAMEANQAAEARTLIDKARKAQPNNLMALYMLALADFREGKNTQARDNLQQVLKSAPNHLPSVVLFGAVSYALGSYEQAEQKLSPALELAPQNAYVRKLLASTQLRQGKAKLTLETLKPLLTPQADVQTLSLAGEAYMSLKDSQKAGEYFERAALAAPENAPTQTRLGISHLASGDVQSGLAELEKASRMDPKQTQADSALIMSYMQLRQYDKALAAIDALEKKQPNTALVYNLRGGAFAGKRDLAQARKSFEQALAIDPAFMPAAKNLAQMDMQDKKPDAARKRFQGVLAKEANNIGAMLALADIAAAEKQEKEYLGWVEKAAKADPKSLEPKARQIAYYLAKKEPQQALALAREAQSANSDNPQVWELLGRTQFAAGEKDNAIASFSKVTQFLPDSAPAYTNLGAAFAGAERWNDARTAWTKALTLDPNHFDARRALVSLELQQKHDAEALKLAQQLSSLNPKSPAGVLLEADVLIAQKQYAKAAGAYERALALAPSGAMVIKIHQILLLAGDAKGAETRVLAWLKAHPDDAATRVYLADNLAGRKDYKAAVAQYELALQQAPENVVVLNNLAWAYAQLKDARALPMAEKAAKLAPDQPGVLDTLGWVLVEQGQLPRAVEVLKKAVEKAPKASTARYHYAVALARSGNKAEAKKELESLMAPDQKFPERADAQALLRTL